MHARKKPNKGSGKGHDTSKQKQCKNKNDEAEISIPACSIACTTSGAFPPTYNQAKCKNCWFPKAAPTCKASNKVCYFPIAICKLNQINMISSTVSFMKSSFKKCNWMNLRLFATFSQFIKKTGFCCPILLPHFPASHRLTFGTSWDKDSRGSTKTETSQLRLDEAKGLARGHWFIPPQVVSFRWFHPPILGGYGICSFFELAGVVFDFWTPSKWK